MANWFARQVSGRVFVQGQAARKCQIEYKYFSQQMMQQKFCFPCLGFSPFSSSENRWRQAISQLT